MVNFLSLLLHLLKIFIGYCLPALGTLDLLSTQGRIKYGSDYDNSANKYIYYWLFLLHAELAYRVLAWLMPGTDVAVYLLLVQLAILIVFELKSEKYLISLGTCIVNFIKNCQLDKYVDMARKYIFTNEAKPKNS